MRIIILLLLVSTLQAQNYHTFNVPVSVGGATNASSLLTLNSTTQGFLIPRMTTAQRDAIPTPALGLQIYNTEANTINIFNGTWVALSGGGGIGGTIAAGQVAFGSASNTLSGSNNFFWDNTNERLTVGGSFTGAGSKFNVNGNIQIPTNGLIGAGQTTSIWNRILLYDSGNGNMSITMHNPSWWLRHSANFSAANSILAGSAAGTASARLHSIGSSTANTSLSFLTQNSSATNTFSVGDAGRVTIYKDTESSGTQSSARLMVESGDANTNLVLSPKGTGAFIVGPAPNGLQSGGNARGQFAIDLQMQRLAAQHVASGTSSVIAGGTGNTAGGSNSVVSGGTTNSASGVGATVSGGTSNTASGDHSVVGGYQNQATVAYAAALSGANNLSRTGYGVIAGGSGNTISQSIPWGYVAIGGGSSNDVSANFGVIAGGQQSIVSAEYGTITGGARGRAYNYGQRATGSGMFSAIGDSQTSDLRVFRQVTGFSNRMLSLNGTDTTLAFLPVLATPTGTSRVWNARLQCVAVTNVQGTGGPAAGSVFSETMDITIKRIGTVTSIVNGTPMQSVSVSDIGMSGADFLVDADDTNESLRVRFQPPTIAAADTQIRAVCTVYLTEIGY